MTQTQTPTNSDLMAILNDLRPAPTTKVTVTHHPYNVTQAAERILFYYRHPTESPTDYQPSGQFTKDCDLVMVYYDKTLSKIAPQTEKMTWWQMVHYLVASQLLATAFEK